MCQLLLDRNPDLAEETKVFNGYPAVTREHTPGSHRNSRKTMRLAARGEMRPDSPALRAEQRLVPNQTRQDP